MEITLGGIAAIIAALAFVALVIALIRPIGKLAGVVDRLADAVTELTEHTLPAIDEAAKTVRDANSQIAHIDTITSAAARTSEDISAMFRKMRPKWFSSGKMSSCSGRNAPPESTK